MTALFQKYISEHSRGLKELNNMLSCKPTQLRSERTIKVYTFFHSKVLPLIDTMPSKSIQMICRALSMVYRSRGSSVEDALAHIDKYLTGGDEEAVTIDTEVGEPTTVPCDSPVVSIQTERSSSPVEVHPAEPEAPTHAVAERKQERTKKVPRKQKKSYSQDEVDAMIAEALSKQSATKA